MKRIIWLAAGLVCWVTVNAQSGDTTKRIRNSSASLGYAMMLPMGDMKAGWSSAHGLGGDFMIGFKKAPFLSVGLEGSIGMYAYNERTEDYLIFNGVLASSEVSFSSNVGSVGLKTKFESPGAQLIKPYATVAAGVFFMNSDITLGDWWSSSSDYYCDDAYSNSKTLVNDADWYASIGGGIKIDLSPKKKPGLTYIDLSAGYMGGGEIKYANMNRINEVPAGPGETKDVIKIVFINSITNERQEMQLAEVYRHPISLMQMQLKFTLSL